MAKKPTKEEIKKYVEEVYNPEDETEVVGQNPGSSSLTKDPDPQEELSIAGENLERMIKRQIKPQEEKQEGPEQYPV